MAGVQHAPNGFVPRRGQTRLSPTRPRQTRRKKTREERRMGKAEEMRSTPRSPLTKSVSRMCGGNAALHLTMRQRPASRPMARQYPLITCAGASMSRRYSRCLFLPRDALHAEKSSRKVCSRSLWPLCFDRRVTYPAFEPAGALSLPPLINACFETLIHKAARED